MKEHLILAINLGSTSTKYAVYEGETPVFTDTIQHPKEELSQFSGVFAQREYRQRMILDGLKARGFDIRTLSAVVGRGGLTKPLPGGTFVVDEAMLQALGEPKAAKHASSLSGVLASDIASQLGLPSYIVDAVVTDELEPLARVSGFEGVQRQSIFHALNQKAVARRAAAELGKTYQECRLVVAHMGGGVSVGAHVNGRVIDVNNALDGDGPFSPERCGGLPVCSVIDLCFSGEFTKQQLSDKLIKQGGFMSYLGVNDGRKIEEMACQGDEKAKLIQDAFSYQMAKEIGAMAAVLCGKLDAVILTGGLAYSKPITQGIIDRVSFLGPVITYPGENEMLALAQGALRVLLGQEQPKHYGE